MERRRAQLLLLACALLAGVAAAAPEKTVTPLPPAADTVVPLPSGKVDAVPWPTNPVTGKRYIGIKEFVIVLHENVVTEERELNAWMNESASFINNGALAKLRAKKADAEASLVPTDTKVADWQRRIAEVRTEVTALNKRVMYRKKAVDRARRALRRTDFNWNQTIAHTVNQLDTARTALRDVEAIFPLLRKPNSQTPVATLLNQASDNAASAKGNPTVATMLQTAAQSAQNVQGTEAMELILNGLLAQLQAHIMDLKKQRTSQRLSRARHVGLLTVKLAPFVQKMQELQQLVNVSLSTIPDYEDNIARLRARQQPVRRRIQALENAIQQEQDELARLQQQHGAELALVKMRADTIEAIHQNVKARLLSGSPIDRARLYAVDNRLAPRGSAPMQWSTYFSPSEYSDPAPSYPSTLRNAPVFRRDSFGGVVASAPYGIPIPAALQPADAAANLCASWQFNERDGNPFVIDASGRGNDGLLHGPVQRIRARRTGGAALLFDGMQTYADLGKVGLLGQSLSEFAVELWVRTLDTHPALSSMLKVIQDGVAGVLALEPNRRVGRPVGGVWPVGQQASAELDFEPGTTLAYLRDSSGKVLAGHVKAPYFDNRWHHLRWVVMDATQNKMAFYMDGRLYPWIATVEQGPSAFAPLQQDLFLGAGNNRGRAEGFFDGALGGVRFFCGKDVSKPAEPCCRRCAAATKPCADMCISVNATCHLEVGCACALESAAPAPSAPTGAQIVPVVEERATWKRGDSPLNRRSIFPGGGSMVPQEATVEFTPAVGEVKPTHQ